ncbi:MAG: AAA family ATPase [Rhodocyclaceae bacterium]|nr:AAA family ATPase [Rhodocyclaceae bacterium]
MDAVAAEFESAPLALRLLGPMELFAAGERVALPRSKKTRALLAYLAASGRPHRRDRLCALLWDMTDDPRGALRWSLSRLRKVVSADLERIEADHQQVFLSPAGMRIDACELARIGRAGPGAMDTAELDRAAALYRGEFLEGLELPDFLDFSAWCIDQREQARRSQCEVLSELVDRLRDEPERALHYARQRAQTDAFNPTAQKVLLRLLLELGKVAEAQQRFDHAQRLFRQVSAPDAIALEQAWNALRKQPSGAAVDEIREHAPLLPGVDVDADADQGGARPAFVGRQALLARLEGLVERALQSGVTELALVTGEPGLGKSRLAERLSGSASVRGCVVVSGRAFEAESSRPFGPWADALAIDLQQTVATDSPASREHLFDSLRARLAARAGQGRGVLVVLDDLQWFDRNSTELLHYLVRTYDRGPMMVLMLARGGELPDNEAALRLLRGLRRDRTVHQIELEPLGRDDIANLVGAMPGGSKQHVVDVAGGNPLYALEFVRARSEGLAGTPPTLLQLVRERVAKLPDRAADALRWGAVLGHAIDLGRLEGLMSQPADELVNALERLEHSALLRIDTTRVHERYVFAHDLIREAVYGDLSHPRRRLMHRKLALLLEPQAADAAVAAELAHHASLAGEALLGVRACITAGQHALRVFANSEAEALARRGLRLAGELDEAQRVESSLDLLHVLYAARTPEREQAARDARELAERALDLGLTRAARQGFQMVSYLRWENSSLADAHANILQAERVSRLAEPGERAVTLAQAARCLVLLERNLQQAEAFVLEADAVGRREGRSSAAVSFALGMIAAHRGDAEAAVEAFTAARNLARQQGEHLAEFGAIEHHVMLDLDRGQIEAAIELASDLVELGRRVRPGAELPSARALLALAQWSRDPASDDRELAEAVEAVRQADAKYELSYLLSRWAERLLATGMVGDARVLANEALEVARAIGRSSDLANAAVILVEAGHRQGSRGECDRLLGQLEPLAAKDLSARTRRRIASLQAQTTAVDKRAEGCERP